MVSVSGPYTELHKRVYIHCPCVVHKRIVDQHIVETCREVFTFYCCNNFCISELQEHASSHCSLLWYTKGIVQQQNYYKIGAASLNSTCLHVYNASSQVIESQELACRIVCMGLRCFLWFSKKGDVYTIPLFCTSPNSSTSLSFRWWSSPVSEIREFNRKKMNTYFDLSPIYPTVQMNPLLHQT